MRRVNINIILTCEGKTSLKEMNCKYMPVPKNVTKRDAVAKKGIISSLILSSLDS